MIWVGTAGYHYQDWRGPVYPPEVKDLLGYYSGIFPFTELNVTFYRLLSPPQVARMAAKVPPEFRFFIKGYQGLTHRREEARESVAPFLESLGPLAQAGQLAGVLLQFPNSFRLRPENREYLGCLREALGPDLPAVVEFRHREWTAEGATFELLRSLGYGYACVDEPQFKGLVPPLVAATAAPGYVRFHGRNYRKWWAHETPDERYDYLYSEAELVEWVPRILDLHRQTELVYVSMNNHRGGQAVINGRMLAGLLAEAGAPVQPPPGPPPALTPALAPAAPAAGHEAGAQLAPAQEEAPHDQP